MLQQVIVTRQIASHRIHALIPFQIFNSEIKPADLGPPDWDMIWLSRFMTNSPDSPHNQNQRACQNWLPVTAHEALATRYAKTNIWQPAQASTADGLHPHVQALIDGQGENMRLACLTDTALRLVADPSLTTKKVAAEKKEKIARYSLILKLSNSARRRIAPGNDGSESAVEINDVGIKICALRLASFRTGMAVADVEIEVYRLDKQPLTTVLLSEVLATLGHVHKLHWHQIRGKDIECALPADFDLTDMVATLVEGPNASRHSALRTFLATYCSLERMSDQKIDHKSLLQTAKIIARHFTADYAVNSDPNPEHTSSEFENIAHVAEREGSATIVDLNDRTDGSAAASFIHNYRTA